MTVLILGILLSSCGADETSQSNSTVGQDISITPRIQLFSSSTLAKRNADNSFTPDQSTVTIEAAELNLRRITIEKTRQKAVMTWTFSHNQASTATPNLTMNMVAKSFKAEINIARAISCQFNDW